MKPTDVYRDNGGNFAAADKEIRKGVKNWQSKQVSDALLQKEPLGILILRDVLTKADFMKSSFVW